MRKARRGRKVVLTVYVREDNMKYLMKLKKRYGINNSEAVRMLIDYGRQKGFEEILAIGL